MQIVCPRCKKAHFRTFIINRYNTKMPIQKCLICGYLWINDADLINLTKVEAKKMFVETLMKLGKEKDGTGENTS